MSQGARLKFIRENKGIELNDIAEYLGYKRRKLTPIDEMKYGVIRIDEFYKNKIGYAFGFETLTDWLKVEEFYILEATNGEVFKDDLGVFSIVRNNQAPHTNSKTNGITATYDPSTRIFTLSGTSTHIHFAVCIRS